MAPSVPARCLTCGLNGPPMRVRSMRTTKLPKLRKSAEDGCKACFLLHRGIRKFLDNYEGDELDQSVLPKDRSITLRYSDTTSPKDFEVIIDDRLEVSVSAWKNTPWLEKTMPRLPCARELPPNTSPDETLGWARECLQRCRSHHTSCWTVQDPSASMPKRVLDVGRSSGDEVRLAESSGASFEPYVSLSHCWGKRPLIRTLFSNVHEHLERIPWDALPLTFQQAVEYVRRLEVRYLWIDSLCIVQDDREEWAEEAGKMHSIYQNSFLVISATKSSQSDQGLFAQVGRQHSTYTVSVQGDDGQDEQVCFRRKIPPLDRSCPDLPTLSRGWIFQERFLSPLVLHFGPQQLYWECLEESSCLATHDKIEPVVQQRLETTKRDKFFYMDQFAWRPKAYLNPHCWRVLGNVELVRCWHRMVSQFTSLRLTNELDIFPALSGITKSFQTVKQSRYLAGLWENTLLLDLLWHVDGLASEEVTSHLDMQRPASYRAPTWSWASIKWPVSFADTGRDGHEDASVTQFCEVVEAHCTLGTSDPTGAISDGYLLLRGMLWPSRITYDEEAAKSAKWPRQLFSLSVLEKHSSSTVYADYNVSMAGLEHVASGSEVWCLPMGTHLHGAKMGMLVLKYEGAGDVALHDEVYKRIAFVEVKKPANLKTKWVGDVVPDSLKKTLVRIV